MYSYLDYLPQDLQELREYRVLGDISDPQARAAWEYTVQQYYNQFIETADLPTIRRWEGVYRITPLPSDTLETRRMRILAKFMQRLPFTWKVLLEYLDIFSDHYTPTRDFARRHFGLQIVLHDNLKLPELAQNLRTLLPANMTVTVWALLQSGGTVSVGAFPCIAQTIRIKPYQAGAISETAGIAVGVVPLVGQQIQIKPKGE